MALVLSYIIPGESSKEVTLSSPANLIGSLASNHIILKVAGVEPIHAIIERPDADSWVITDLGSGEGIKLNGQVVEVEARLKEGDQIEIAGIKLLVTKISSVMATTVLAKGIPSGRENEHAPVQKQPEHAKTEIRPGESNARKSPELSAKAKDTSSESLRSLGVLFSPRSAVPSGTTLEVVSYWDDTVLEVEHFGDREGRHDVTIGIPPKADFFAAGPKELESFTLAKVKGDKFRLNILDDMKVRLRRAGKVEEQSKPAKIDLGIRDIAHIKYGAISYFLIFIKPPVLDLPPRKVRDPLLAGLLTFMSVFYIALNLVLIKVVPKEENKLTDEIWSIVYLPEEQKPQPKPEPVKIEKPKEVKIAEVKKDPPKPKLPPPPKPQPVKPAEPKVVAKVEQPKPVEKPKPKAENISKTLANENVKKQPTPSVKPPQELNKLASVGMPSTGAKSPDFKLAGPNNGGPKGAAGGPRGGGNGKTGGERKGNKKASVMGVEGVNNDKPSGVNLDKLGVGVGQILSKTGPGAVHTNFKSSGGGAGGGSGSGKKTYGLGGVGTGHSVGIAGSGSQINNFGSGTGGLLSGDGGSGGLGGTGIGKGFGGPGHGNANVSIPPGDPVVSGGLTEQEVMQVIRTHLNEIRHCYERLLQREPKASGKITASFVIAANGLVNSANINNSSISDSQMQGCVTGAIRKWKFPQPRGGEPVSIKYPFVFNPL